MKKLKNLAISIVFNYPKYISSFYHRKSVPKFQLFFLIRFLEYLHALFTYGLQTAKKQILNNFIGKRRCVRCIILRVWPCWKTYSIFLLDTQSLFLLEEQKGFFPWAPQLTVFELQKVFFYRCILPRKAAFWDKDQFCQKYWTKKFFKLKFKPEIFSNYLLKRHVPLFSSSKKVFSN